MRPTGKTYSIRTLDDFRLIPKGRRRACLRDFERYLEYVDALKRAYGDALVDVAFCYIDDDKQDDSIVIRAVETDPVGPRDAVREG